MIKKSILFLFTAIAVLLASSLSDRSAAQAASHDQQYSVKVVTHHIKYQGKDLYGRFYLPNRKGKLPTIILSHEFDSNTSSTAPYARALAKRGFLTYVYDFSGGGNQVKSSGKTTDMTVFTEASDLKAVMDALLKDRRVDRKNLFLSGGSQGGFVTAIVAAQRARQVKAIVLLYPAFVIPDRARATFKRLSAIPKRYNFWGVQVGRGYFSTVYNYDIYKHIAAFKKDVLIIHGDSDSLVPLRYSRQAVKTYAHARLIVLKGADHVFYGHDRTLAARDMIRFFKSESR